MIGCCHEWCVILRNGHPVGRIRTELVGEARPVAWMVDNDDWMVCLDMDPRSPGGSR